MSTLSTAEIRAAARAKAKAATEALPELHAARESAEAERQRAEEALSEANRARYEAILAKDVAEVTPAAALALIRLVEGTPHLIGALKAQQARRIISTQDHAALVRRKLVYASLGQRAQLTPLTFLGEQVLRLHAEITAETKTTEDKQ